MPNLNEYRSEIDELHKQIFYLVLKRFSIAKQIAELKKSESKNIEDLQRESQLIHQFDSEISDPQMKIAVQNIVRSILNESKSLMKEVINEKK